MEIVKIYGAKNDYQYNLIDDDNKFYLESVIETKKRYANLHYPWNDNYIDMSLYYDLILGYDIGTYKFLFNDNSYFEYERINKVGMIIVPTDDFILSFKAFARDIKIEEILNG